MRTSVPFFLVHLLPLLAIFTGVTWTAVILFMATYWGRMFFITAGYHRYFAHRAFRTGRAFQFVLAFGGCMSAQKGPLWWAGHHRIHHRYTDTIDDPHTPMKGFWWSHVGWILSDETSTRPEGTMKDFEKFPEIRFISKQDWIAPWTLGIACFLIGGWSGLADRVLPLHGAAVALHVHDQLAGPRPGPAPVRHRWTPAATTPSWPC